MGSFAGWTRDAIALVERSMAAHGGLEAWRSTASIRVPVRSMSGSLIAWKGYPRSFPAPLEYEVFPHECVTLFHGYPSAGERGRFAHGDVAIEDADGGRARLESGDHRRTFQGFAKLRRWTILDALYIFGYALWHYHVLPFTLGGARLHGVVRRHGEPVAIEVEFSEDVPTHCRRQRFYFGLDGRIVRHDYVAEVIGPMARGAHFWEDYDRVGGLLVARRRRVVARLGRYATPWEVLCVQMGDPVVSRRPI
jgi:hypothetical protein